MSVDVNQPLPTVEELEARFFEKQRAELEARRDAAAMHAREQGDFDAKLRKAEVAYAEADRDLQGMRYGAAMGKVFVDWVKGTLSRDAQQKAAIVEDATGEILVPSPIEIDITNIARERGTLRSLADVRPTDRSKLHATLLSAAATGWGKLETGTSATDAGITPAAVAPDPTPVFDLATLALIGVDELADSPASALTSIKEAIGVAIADAEDTAFANGTGSGQPSGLALAANVSLVPSGQKVAVGVTNTPTWAQLQTIPWLLPTRYRNNAVWLMHPTSASKVAALTAGSGEGLIWSNPGPNGPGLLGWPAYVVDGLPDPATAGTTDASIWFVDMKSAYRVVDRQRTTVTVLRQRYAEQGLIGIIVRHRVGGDLLRPAACAIYTQ
jgi:HK97 family phage major capsid protein